MPRKPKTTTPIFAKYWPNDRWFEGFYNYKKRTTFGRWFGKYRKESSGWYYKNEMGSFNRLRNVKTGKLADISFSRPKRGGKK